MSDRPVGVIDSTGAPPAYRVPNTPPAAQRGAYPPPGQTPTYQPGATGRGVGSGRTPETSAQAVLRNLLESWGLGSLTDWAWGELTRGASNEQILIELRKQDAYKTRFAGNEQRTKAGLTPMSEADYLAYEDQARQMFHYYGLPATFYDQPEDFTKFIGGDVSMSELHDRVLAAHTELNATPEVQRAEARLYGVHDGAQLAYYLDPNRALPLLQRQAQASQLAGAAAQTGYGEIDRAQAERLAALGISTGDAATGFSHLASMTQVTGPILGDTQPGLSTDEQLAAVFDQNAAAVEKLSRRQRARVADFRQAGGYAPTQGQQ